MSVRGSDIATRPVDFRLEAERPVEPLESLQLGLHLRARRMGRNRWKRHAARVVENPGFPVIAGSGHDLAVGHELRAVHHRNQRRKLQIVAALPERDGDVVGRIDTDQLFLALVVPLENRRRGDTLGERVIASLDDDLGLDRLSVVRRLGVEANRNNHAASTEQALGYRHRLLLRDQRSFRLIDNPLDLPGPDHDLRQIVGVLRRLGGILGDRGAGGVFVARSLSPVARRLGLRLPVGDGGVNLLHCEQRLIHRRLPHAQ
jgi:hypothetical protein